MIKIILISFLFILILHSGELPDPYKGQVFYKYYIATELEMDGIEFTKKFSYDEWKDLYKNNSDGFFKEFSTLDRNIINSEILLHLEAFTLMYARDTELEPNCN